jgi:hypothetical protein
MKVTVISGIAVFTSTILTADLETLATVTPEALVVKNEEKEIDFKVATGTTGSIGTYGITFDKTDASGYASTSVSVGDLEPDKIKGFIAEKYGKALAKMNAFEATAPEKIEAAKNALSTAMDSITIM